MSLDTRLRKLENEQGGRPCIVCGFPGQTQQPIVEFYDEADDPPPPLGDEESGACSLCGRQPLFIQVVYVDRTADKSKG